MVKRFAGLGYSLTLALWVGGMSLFTFLVTPAIFNAFNRDEAGRIVGVLFEWYFYYVLLLSVMALVLAYLDGGAEGAARRGHWLKIALLVAAVVINLFVSFLLYPEIKEVKSKVASFVTEPEDSENRLAFGRLHAISGLLNLLVLADGAALLAISVKECETPKE